MSPADIVRLLVLSEWGVDDQEAESVNHSGIGPIGEIDVTSLVKPRTEDLDSITVASCSSPVSGLREGALGPDEGVIRMATSRPKSVSHVPISWAS
jgi:hypothetical protein